MKLKGILCLFIANVNLSNLLLLYLSIGRNCSFVAYRGQCKKPRHLINGKCVSKIVFYIRPIDTKTKAFIVCVCLLGEHKLHNHSFYLCFRLHIWLSKETLVSFANCCIANVSANSCY